VNHSARTCPPTRRAFARLTAAAASLLAVTLLTSSAPAQADDRFAAEVVSVTGNFNNSLYRDPASLLGKPTTYVRDQFPAPGGTPNGTVAASMVFAPYNTAPDGTNLITTINEGEHITVRFDTPIFDDPGHWYGLDFTVFGNAFFTASDWVYGDSNMEDLTIAGGGFLEPLLVSVSPDGLDWYTYESGPFADDYFPTNPFAWDRDADAWGAELDWTKPINPALTAAAFTGLSVADAIDLYDGSAGGTSFDLAESGFSSISYIRVSGVGDRWGGEVDGFARVGFASTAAVPEAGTLGLLLAATPALGVLSVVNRRRRKRAA